MLSKSSSDLDLDLFSSASVYFDRAFEAAPSPHFAVFSNEHTNSLFNHSSVDYLPIVDSSSLLLHIPTQDYVVLDLVQVFLILGSSSGNYVTPSSYPFPGSHSVTSATTPYRASRTASLVLQDYLVPPGTVFNLPAGSTWRVGAVRRCVVTLMTASPITRNIILPVDRLYYGRFSPTAFFFDLSNVSFDFSDSLFYYYFMAGRLYYGRLYGMAPRAVSSSANTYGYRFWYDSPVFCNGVFSVIPGSSIPTGTPVFATQFTGYMSRLYSSAPGTSLVTFNIA